MDNQLNNAPTSFGYNLLRDHLLPTLLGKHEDDILYWLGKDLARNFPIFSIDELPVFFEEAGWGRLTIEKQTKDEAHYQLKNSSVLQISGGSCSLEAGFLAEQYQKLNGFLTECFGEKKPQEDHISFIVKWDPKSPIT